MYLQRTLRKELLIAPFVERLESATLGKSYRYILRIFGTPYLSIAFLLKF